MTKRPKCHSEHISITFQDINKWKNKITKVRNCFHCEEILMFNFFKGNASKLGFSKEQALEIWNSKHVQLYCCGCVSKIKESLRISEKIKKLKEKNYGGFY